MKELLLSLRSVMDLELGPWCTEVLSLLELKGWKVPPYTRFCLTLNALGHKGSIPGILKSSPNLKTLVIRGQSVPDNEVFITRDLAAAYLQNRNLDLVHLKTIMITGFTG